MHIMYKNIIHKQKIPLLYLVKTTEHPVFRVGVKCFGRFRYIFFQYNSRSPCADFIGVNSSGFLHFRGVGECKAVLL